MLLYILTLTNLYMQITKPMFLHLYTYFFNLNFTIENKILYYLTFFRLNSLFVFNETSVDN